MKNILLIGKMNEVMRDLHHLLSKDYNVQVGTDDVSVLSGLIRVAEPDLIIISLVGIYAEQDVIFAKLQKEFSRIPVLTIGVKEERDHFLKYYDGGQFENILRPVDRSAVNEAIRRRLKLPDTDVVQEEKPENFLMGLLASANAKKENKDEGSEKRAEDKKKILIVDDDPSYAGMVRTWIKDIYKTTVVTAGMQAITFLLKNHVDLILLDYEMPVVDGPQVLQMLRSEPATADIPVVFLTGVSTKEEIMRVLALKPDGYILKTTPRDDILVYLQKKLQGGENV